MILKLIPVPPGRSIKNLAEISSEASFVDVLNDIKAALPPGIDIIERPVSATLANGYIAVCRTLSPLRQGIPEMIQRGASVLRWP